MSGMRLAYLVSRYPHPAHAFIRREVEALRALGTEIDLFAIHRVDDEHLTSFEDEEESRTTYAVRPLAVGRLLGAHLDAVLGHPLAYARTVWLALWLPPGRHGRLSSLFYFAEAIPIWREARRRGLKHVHAHFANPSADVAMMAAAFGRAARGVETWSFTAHGTDFYDDMAERLAIKVRRATFVTSVSDFGRSQLMRLVEEQHWPKIRLVRCGLDPGWFSAPARNGRVGSPLRLLAVGRLAPEKGHAILLQALAEVARRGVQVQLEIVGGGERLPALQRLARELGIADRVDFAGEVGQHQIKRHYAAADAFCLASLGEGLPVALMEAMASELPVIASRIHGIPELVVDGESGLLIAPGRPDELAAAIETLAADPELCRRMGRAGREKVVAEFRAEDSAPALWRAFAEALNDAAAASGKR
jgi:glycosyltransferase involved in cell wall biosynthesis